MAPALDSSPSVADGLRRLRLGGQAVQALELAGQALRANPQDWDVMGEIVRILVCLGEGDSAAGFYKRMAADPRLNQQLEPEVLARLALLLDRRDLLQDMEPPASPTWLVTFLKSGVDPVELLLVEDLQLRIEIGHPVFALSGVCPHCGHAQKQELRNTLLVYRVWTCASCLGQVSLDHVTARDLLQNRYSRQLAVGLQAVDDQIIEHIKPRLTGQVQAPFVVQALGQGYQFILNELALRFAPPGDDTDGSVVL